MQYRKSFLFLALVLISSTAAFSITLKIGSLAPRNSPWDKSLNEIAAEWNRISNGSVQLKIYPGGITGNEDDTLRKIRFGALDGMVVSTMGLNKISLDLFTLSLPFLIKNEGELNYVMEKMQNRYMDILSEKGFELISWTKAGWMNIFSRDPVYYPEDLEQQKLSFTTGEEVLIKILKDLGFYVVPEDSIDWLSGLQSGRTDALILSPLVAAVFQVFPIADNMLDFQIAPLLGAIVFSKRSWRKIPEEYRQDFIDAANKKLMALDSESRELEEKALQVMLDYGLKVNSANERAVDAWIELFNNLYAQEGIIGTMVSRDIFNELVHNLDEYRLQSGSNAD